MNVTLNTAQLEQIMDEARAEVVKTILAKNMDELTLISKSQAAGILDVDGKTLDAMKIPRVVLVPKKKIAYRLSDIKAAIERCMEY